MIAITSIMKASLNRERCRKHGSSEDGAKDKEEEEEEEEERRRRRRRRRIISLQCDLHQIWVWPSLWPVNVPQLLRTMEEERRPERYVLEARRVLRS